MRNPSLRTSSWRETFLLCLHIARRNWAVYRKDLVANISPTVADPAFIMVSLGLGLSPYLASVEGLTYMQYLAPGLTVATAFFTSFFESSYGFYLRMTFENVFKAMLTTPIGVREIIWGEFFWQGLKGGMMAVGVGAVLAISGLMANPLLLPFTFFVGFAVAIPCGAIGMISASQVRNMNQFQTVYSFIIAPLYFLSGIFFPAEKMTPAVRLVAELFPVVHGVHLAQSLFWNRIVVSDVAFHGGAMLVQAIVLCTVAQILVQRKLIT